MILCYDESKYNVVVVMIVSVSVAINDYESKCAFNFKMEASVCCNKSMRDF